ncbi:sigma factor [Rhodopirellula sp. JC639]|uniref:sigma factor n=1 Tax=Stieleria mannarensis TaxID=2755585 RepID=UPI0016039D5C|nr:sigma factor [Rhodopirellula sp. JC639]
MPTELDFVSEYSRWENEVYRFILSLVPHRPDADELMQETAKTLWTKYFQAEEPIRSFKAWACQIAFYEVLRYRKSKARERLNFSQDVIEQLANARRQHDDALTERRVALQACLQELKWPDIELLRTRYGITPDEVSAATDSPAGQPITNAMSKRLQRVRRMLAHCVEKRIAGGTL